jgi:hypothetical protein
MDWKRSLAWLLGLRTSSTDCIVVEAGVSNPECSPFISIEYFIDVYHMKVLVLDSGG